MSTVQRAIGLLVLIPLFASGAQATVTGRYVYFGNALSESMSLAQVEVYSQGKNVILHHPEVFTSGLDYSFYMKKRTPDQLAQAAAMLVDGNVDTSLRRVDFGSQIGGGYLDITLRYTSFELDLGKEMPIDSVAIYRSHYTTKQFNDLGWRVMVVLDEQRRIVSWEAFNVYGPEWKTNAGRWAFNMQPAKGAPAGRVVPLGARAWLSEAEYLRDFLGKPVVDLVSQVTPADKARLERFQHRNDPSEIESLGKRFFRIVDLNSPGLDAVRTLVQAGKYADALEAFKQPFFQRLGPLKDWNGGEGTSIYVFYTWTTEPDTRYTCRSRDLRNQLYADKQDLSVKHFIPGLLPPAKFSFPFQMRPLLLNYAVSHDAADLRLWEEMTDDWGIGFQEAADQDPKKLRDYFVLDPGIRTNLKDLYMAAQSDPNFVGEVSGATLARFLMPILEEIPVANWRVTRKCNFNHTYNCIPGGLELAQLLDEFYSGQRLEREMHQAYERLYTLSQYRDGSMVEVGDEGHYLAPVWAPANLYGEWAHDGRPAWFTPALETYFLDNYRANIIAGVRNESPTGANIRWNADVDTMLNLEYELGTKDPYWRNGSGSRMVWGDYYPTLCLPILKEKEPRAVVDTIFGKGRPTFENTTKKQEQEDVARIYNGAYQGPPSFLSDWMPYTGLWYFRGGWDREASFLHMVKPAIANNLGGGALYPLTNKYGSDQFNDTSYRLNDYATPLLTGLGILIDGLPPCPGEGAIPSGSKQGTFTQAVEKPQPSRWYTDATVDFGEALYHGGYRSVGLEWDAKQGKSFFKQSAARVEQVDTARQIFQVRPARLFLQIDRMRYATPNETHTQTLTDTVILTAPEKGEDSWAPEEQVQVLPDAHKMVTRNLDNPGVTVAWFGQPTLNVKLDKTPLGHASFAKLGGPAACLTGYRKTTGREVRGTWSGTGESVLLTLIRASKPNDEPIEKLNDLSTDSVAGVHATMKNGVGVTLLVARHVPAPLTIGPVSISGESLLVIETPGAPVSGMALGALKLELAGKSRELSTNDFAFTLDPSGDDLKAAPVRRPIDPPTIGPAVNTFSDSTTVAITSTTPDVDIDYIAEKGTDDDAGNSLAGQGRGTVNATQWQRYTGPFTVDDSTFVRARAIRKGVAALPFTAAGIDASAISYGFFHKRAPKPALADAPANLQSGLAYDYLEDRWFALWTYTDQLEAKQTGATNHLLDVGMRATDGPFAVRYHGCIAIPRDGVYTFYGPDEYVNNRCEPGYDLRLFIDGEEWYLGQTWHGRGMWSVPLKQGLHQFKVTFADARDRDLENQRIDLWEHYPWAQTTWRGTAPAIDISGPGFDRQIIPDAWLKH